MAKTTKALTQEDQQNAIRYAFNDVDDSLTTNGFLVGKVGHKVTMTVETTNVANDTEVYNFKDLETDLYEITVIYTDGTRETMMSAERTA